MAPSPHLWLLYAAAVVLLVFPRRVAAFGAGNIPSIAQVEGTNWRHGDIEDVLSTLLFIHSKRWTKMLIKRTYFGNWLRDYSQAVDVGSLKGTNAATIRILVWVLSFLSFGYATEEFEVTEERLGVYRPEEHIDNPLGYADNMDARMYDMRLRGPVEPIETQIDMRTGMKNYIANEQGHWATSAGYLRYSIARSVHFARLYLHSSHGSGQEGDLCEALRCLGQSLHCMEDFSAHSNYCELALRELGLHEVYPHCGSATEVHIGGKKVFPLVTGTFGAVDFLHSVIGEANDHFTQSEVDQMNAALQNAEGITQNAIGGVTGSRGMFGSSSSSGGGTPEFISLVEKLPANGGGFASQARDLMAASAEQEEVNARNGQNANQIPGMSTNFDPVRVSGQIYPILLFRDKIVRYIESAIAKVPGLEKLIDRVSETLTAFVMGLLAPFVRPILKALTKSLKDGSSGVINASANSQLATWTDPHCSDPTHSMLSKDHFTNLLNACAGRVAVTVLQYAVPRIIYAWENVGVPVDEVVNDLIRAFHHPALRDGHLEIHRNMFNTVKKWLDEHPKRHEVAGMLSSDSVRNGKNHILSGTKIKGSHGHGHGHGHSHGAARGLDDEDSDDDAAAATKGAGDDGHGKVAGSLWSKVDTKSAPGAEPQYLATQPSVSYGYARHLQGGDGGGYYNAATGQAPAQYGDGQYGPPAPAPPNQGYGYQSAPPPQGGWGPQGYQGSSQYGGWGSGEQQQQQPQPQYPPPQYPPAGGSGSAWNQYPGSGYQ